MPSSDIAAEALERPVATTPISDAIRRHLRTRAYIRAELIGRGSLAEHWSLSLKPTRAPWHFL